MIFRLIRRLTVPGSSLLIFALINNNLDAFNRFIPNNFVEHAYYVSGMGIWLAGGWGLSILINILVWDEYFRKRRGIEPADIFETLVLLGIIILTVMGIVGIVFGKSVTVIWAMTTVAGGLIGFSLKEMIADFFTGITLNLDKTFKVGDWISLPDHGGEITVGQVQEITWRTTRIKQADGSSLIYPNNVISNMPLKNLVLNGFENRFSAKFIIDQGINEERVMRVLTAAAKSVPGIVETSKVKVKIDAITLDGIVYKVGYWINTETTSPSKAKEDLMQAALYHLKQANIPLSSNSEQYIGSIPVRKEDPDKNRGEIIEKVASLKLLNPLEKEQLARSIIRHELKEGKRIIHEGDDGDSLFIPIEGVLDICVFKQEKNKMVKVGQIFPGEFFGERSLLLGEARNATVIAASDCVIYEITRDHLDPLLKARPSLLEEISARVAERDVRNSKTFANYTSIQQKHEQNQAALMILSKMKNYFNFKDSNGLTSSPDRDPFSYH